MILWIGSLLLISSMMALAAEENGAGRDRLIATSRRLFHVSANIGAAVAIIFGVFAILAQPSVLQGGWLHVKILLVLILLAAHARLYLRITALQREPLGKVRRGEFSMIHGIVSLLVLGILALVFLKPF